MLKLFNQTAVVLLVLQIMNRSITKAQHSEIVTIMTLCWQLIVNISVYKTISTHWNIHKLQGHDNLSCQQTSIH